MSAAQQLKREPSVAGYLRGANRRSMSVGTLADRYRGAGIGLGRGETDCSNRGVQRKGIYREFP